MIKFQKNSKLLNIPLVILLLVFLSSCTTEKTPVDAIIYNAKIISMDSNSTIYEALAIKDGAIVELGTSKKINKVYKSDNNTNLEGKTVYPGFIDAHCHFVGYAKNSYHLDLKNTTSFEDMLNLTIEYAKKKPRNWILGRGWNEENWEYKTTVMNKIKLDLLFPDIPVILRRVDGHSALVNQVALDMAGLTAESKISGGEVVVFNGRATGMLIDLAVDKVLEKLPKYTNEELANAMIEAEKRCFEVGLTTLSDAGLEMSEVMLIDSMQEKGSLQMRFYIMLNPKVEEVIPFMKTGGIVKDKLRVKSIKLYSDGSLGSRSALLKESYCDKKNHFGLSLIDSDTIAFWTNACNIYNFQLNTHCIGDSSNSRMLKAYAKELKGKNDKRWRIEHAQVMDVTEYQYFKDYSILPSVQPTHAISDSKMAPKRLCSDGRMEGAYSYATLLKQNGIIALGTDFPVEGISPISTYFAAVKRQLPDGSQFRKEEALTHDEALKGITIWAAQANFMENSIGSLEVNKKADIVVLDKPLKNASQQKDVHVAATMVNGIWVYIK